MIASKHSNIDSTEGTVRMLLDAGAKTDIQNNDRRIALRYAIEYVGIGSSENTVNMLLDA